jgi:putative ABC transport system permease protein
LNHVSLAVRNLKRRPVRSLLTVLGVALAVGSFITLYGLSRSIDENVGQMLDERGIHLSIARRGTADLFGGTIPLSLASQFAAVPGVTAIAGELIALAETDDNVHVLALGWADGSFLWTNLPLLAGRMPHGGERGVALIGSDVANALGKRIGDRLVLLGLSFEIIGITDYRSIITRNALIVPLEDLQEAIFRPGAVTFLHLRVAHPGDVAEIDRISKAIEAMSDVRVSTNDSVMHNDEQAELLRAVSSAMAWVALSMGILMVLNTLLMAVLERTREIGILSAIGWSEMRVMGSLVIEGLMLSAIGGAVGALFGMVGSHLLSGISAIGRYLTISPSVGLIATSAIAAVLLGIFGSLYPAWLSTRQDPATALDRP